MIEVQHLTKQFGGRVALDDVTFEVGAGQVTAFLGPNGAGKTTTMRLILGLDKPSSGEALVDGRPFRSYTDPICRVGALLDTRFAHPRRTAFDHLMVVADTHGIPRARVFEVLEEVGLEAVAGERAGRFSLGMTQRLGIAAALLGRPQSLIFDEPVNGLDIDGVRWFRELCRRCASDGVAVFLSSHLMSEVELVADRVIVLGRGRVLEDARLDDLRGQVTVVEVVTDHAGSFARALEQRGGTVEHVESRSFRLTGLSAAEVGAAAATEGIALERLAEVPRSLEEIYRDLTEETVEFRASAAVG